MVRDRSNFRALMSKRGGAPASVIAFDLLRPNGDDLRLRRIEARRGAKATRGSRQLCGTLDAGSCTTIEGVSECRLFLMASERCFMPYSFSD
jgi:hypothetical protein